MALFFNRPYSKDKVQAAQTAGQKATDRSWWLYLGYGLTLVGLTALYLRAQNRFRRELRAKVRQTGELKRKNRELDAKNKELKALDQMVQELNREVEFKKVIQSLLELGLNLFPQAKHAAFLVFDGNIRKFKFAAAAGWNFQLLKGLTFSREALTQRFRKRVTPIEGGIYLANHFKRTRGSFKKTEFDYPESLIVMTIPPQGEPDGFLVLANPEDPKAFLESDVQRLLRFREHADSAVTKAKILQDLVGAQERLMENAHAAGRAEIATNVLHDLGNTLNSVLTSVDFLGEMMKENRPLAFMEKTLGLLHPYRDELPRFFAEDPRAHNILPAMTEILASLARSHQSLGNEIAALSQHIRKMVVVLQEQHKHTYPSGWVLENYDLNELIRETVRMEGYFLRNQGVEVVESLQPLPSVRVDCQKFKRILFLLLKNAWEAVAKKHESSGRITVATEPRNPKVRVLVTDNGVGIEPEKLPSAFAHQITGLSEFSLHYCANAVKEMDGDIQIFSEGLGRGTTIHLEFPVAE